MSNTKLNNLLFFGKKIALVSMIVPCMIACKDSKRYGIVEYKTDKDVFLRPINGAKTTSNIISFENGYDDEVTRNLYLNMNVGDTICFDYCPVKINHSIIVRPSQAEIGKRYTKVKYYIRSINGTEIDKLPNLAKKQKIGTMDDLMLFLFGSNAIQDNQK